MGTRPSEGDLRASASEKRLAPLHTGPRLTGSQEPQLLPSLTARKVGRKGAKRETYCITRGTLFPCFGIRDL